jgi:hypothetical protein
MAIIYSGNKANKGDDMVKRPSLAESMKAFQGEKAPVQVVVAPAADGPTDSRGAGRGYHAAPREGKKKATASLTPEDHRRLKRLSADTDRTIEELMFEAISDLFAKHGA